MQQNDKQPLSAPAAREPWVSATDRFFDDSLLTGWLRCDLSPELRILYCNAFFYRLMGYDEREALLRGADGRLLPLVFPEDRGIFEKWRGQDAPGDENATSLVRLTRRDGGVVWLRMRGYRYAEADGSPRLLLCCVDVSELMEASEGLWALELELARANEDLGLFSDSLPCALVTFECAPGGISVRYHSDGFYRLVGCSREEYAERSGGDALYPVFEDDRQTVMKCLMALYDGDESVHCSCRLHAGDSVRWVELRGAPGGRTADAVLLNAVLMDVTELHTAMEALRVREEEYRLAIVHSGKLVYRFDILQDAIYLPPEAAELFGMPARLDGVPQCVLEMDVIAPACREDYIGFFQHIRAGDMTGSMRILHKVRGGEERWFDARFTTIFDSAGAPVSAIILFIDVTDARQSGIRDMLDRERLLTALGGVYPVSVGIDLTRDLYRTLGGREIMAKLHPPEGRLSELVEQGEALLAPEFRGMLRAALSRDALSDEKSARLVQYRQKNADGLFHWVELSVLPIHNAYDDTTVGVALLRYIDEQKTAEDELRISEEEVRVAMSRMGRMVCLYDVRTHVLTMPERYALRFATGPVQTDLPGAAVEKGILSEQTAKHYAAFFEAMDRGDKTGSVDYNIRRADGSWRWEHAEFITVFDSDGRAARAVVSVEDTTDARSIEDENARLREQERVLRAVTSHSSRTIYDCDVEAGTVRVIERGANAVGRTAESMSLRDAVRQLGCVLPESRADLERLYKDMKAGVPAGAAKIHFRAANGQNTWQDIRFTLVDAGGARSGMAVISSLDVTREHEQELAYERYRQTIRLGSAADSGMIYVETDVTADLVEMTGGGMLTDEFPAQGSRHTALVGFMAARYFTAEGRERFCAFFSREHLLTLFADGRRELSEDWLAMSPVSGERWVRSVVQMIRDPYSGHVKSYTALQDVSQEKKAALDVQRKAQTDGLTGIFNKVTTEEEIRRRLSEPSTGPCALLFSDLDDLKGINDSCGHAQGDRALALYAGELKSLFRHTDVVGRVGGDEFVVFLSGVGTESALRGALNTLMRRVSALRIGEDGGMGFRVSAGIAFGEAGFDTYEELSRRADKALYHVKGVGKSDYAFYTPDMERASYRYAGHDEAGVGLTGVYTRHDVDRLMSAMCALYPLVLCADLTRNSYSLLRCNDKVARQLPAAGAFDELIAYSAELVHPDDRAAYLQTFSRQALLAACEKGETRVALVCRQSDGGGVFRRICFEVVFVRDAGGGVTEITLARPVPEQGE